MAYEMRAGSGSVFANERKTSEKHPDMTGKIMLPNGEVRWLSIWNKSTGAGKPWLSISVGDLCQPANNAGYSAAHNVPSAESNQGIASPNAWTGLNSQEDPPF
jgi:hypothetical protein